MAKLYETHPITLKQLEEQATQNSITNRLDQDLSVKWYEHKETCLAQHTVVPFRFFASWIGSQAKIYLNRQEAMCHEEKTKRSQTDLPPIQEYPAPRNERNTYQHPQSAQPGNRLPNLPRRSSYSKEYNDSQRTRGRFNKTTYTNDRNGRNTSQLNSSGRFSSEFERPLHESTRNISPDTTKTRDRIMEMHCAWCSEFDKPHNHTTRNCTLLKNANQSDKWKVIYKHRICTKCLGTGHYCRECSTIIPACLTCNMTHHTSLGCRPQEQICNITRD